MAKRIEKKEVKVVKKGFWSNIFAGLILWVIPLYVLVIGIKTQFNCTGGWCPTALVYYFIALFLYVIAKYVDKKEV